MLKKYKILLGPSTFAAENKAPIDRLVDMGFTIVENPYKRKLTRDELQNLLSSDVAGLIAGLETLDREILTRSSLKVISRCGAGMSNIDLDAARELGILVFSTPYGPTRAVAELTLGCLITLIRQVFQMNMSLHECKWDKRIGRQLKGMKVLVIGYGRIGKLVADLLKAFEVETLICDPLCQGAEICSSLPQADVITLHCSGEDQILGPGEFELMKPGVYLLNSARGNLVDETSLIKALDSGKVAGVWFDTFEKEPYNGPLTRYKQVILTPHVGSYTYEGRLQMELDAADNLLQGFKKLENES